MIRNYLKIALRMLWKRKAFTAINATGLALGIAAFLLIMQYVSFEWGVNKYHTHLPDIHRVLLADGRQISEHIPPTVGPLGKENFPEIRAFARIPTYMSGGLVTYAGTDTSRREILASYNENTCLYADHDFLTLFTVPMLTGSGSLREPNTVVISAAQAQKYFGNADPLGQILTLHNQFGDIPYSVTGVFQDVPEQSDLQFTMLFSLQTFANPANLNGNGWAALDNWGTNAYQTFLLLNPGTDIAALEEKFHQLKMRLLPEAEAEVKLQPLRYVHLSEHLSDPYPTNGSLLIVAFLFAVAVLILLIAWINYVNLSTAFALNRAKEVGIRKVVGALRSQLISQYLLESLVLNAISLMLAVLLVQLLQAPFNAFTGKSLSLELLNQGWFWWSIGLILVAGTLASGGYVALVLSGFQPIQTLKGKVTGTRHGAVLRRSLVVFQFAVSVVFIICTFVLYRQLHFMRNQDLGMNIKQIVIIKGPSMQKGNYQEKSTAFLNNLSQLPFVQARSSSGNVPGAGYNFGAAGITRINPQPGDEKKNYSMMIVDDQYLPTYQISLAAGRNFTPVMAQRAWYTLPVVMLNESAARQLGFASAEEAVGQKINWGKEYEIIGVVNDYHHASLKQSIDPTIFLADYNSSAFSIRLDANQMPERIATLQQIYQSLFPHEPFEYYFADESFDRQYQTEQKFGQIFTASSSLAIFIACLGLFGLAAYSAEQRTKEIGIRKVLGASVANIVSLLSGDFLKLIALSFGIATPIAWYAISRGLENFAYPVAFPWWLFLLTGALTACIALATISYQSIKAARANPVKSLRSE